MANFKDIINEFKIFTDNHTQLNDFKWGSINDINHINMNYISLYLTPKNISQENNLSVFNFDIYILDLLEQDESNLIDVFNNTSLIGNDMINYLYDIDIINIDEKNINIIPFVGEFDHFVGGWVYNINITTDIKDCYKKNI